MTIIPLRMAVVSGEPGALAPVAEMALPADYTLFADKASASEAQPKHASLAEHILVADQAAALDEHPKRKPYRAAATSLAFHLALLALFLLGPAGHPPQQLGAEQGLPENLNVAVITEADLKSMSMDPFKQESSIALPPSNPSPPSQETPPEKQPIPEKETKPTPEEANAPPPPEKAPPAQTQKPEDPFGYAARWTEAFSKSMTQAFTPPPSPRRTAQAAASAANLRSFRPAATHKGKSDEFEREVIWALAATKPTGNGNWGITVVSFVVSAEGKLQDLQLLQASGDNWLDTAALMAVRQARLPVPPAGLPAGDRTFHVTYIAR
jgi:periplasmic protein TonB